MLHTSSLKKHWAFLLLLSFVMSLYTGLFGHMNNWLIFKNSFFHLVEGKSLYLLYPDKATDIFLYSPTFALFMAPLAWLPDLMGGVLWNLLGAILLVKALEQLPISPTHKKGVFWISLPEFIGSTQNFQTNIHVIALLIFFWLGLENRQILKSSLAVLGSFFIKVYGVIMLCLLSQDLKAQEPIQLRLKYVGTLILGFIALALAPLLVTDLNSLIFQYQEWFSTHQSRSAVHYGFSLMAVIHGLTGWNLHNLSFQVVGGLSLLGSILYFRQGPQASRLMAFVSICYFLVFFNHGSESPSYIIVMVAFGIHQAFIKNQKLRWTAIAFTLGCVSLLYADPFRPWSPYFNSVAAKAWPLVFLYPMAIFRWGVDTTSACIEPA